MKQQTKKIPEPYREFELEILRLCNEERAKVGVAPLEWYEDAYYFTHKRAEEIYYEWGHTRLKFALDERDAASWESVYTDNNVLLCNSTGGENLIQFQGAVPSNCAEDAVIAWMESEGHRANILNPEYDRVAIAIEWGADNFTLCFVQNFFG